MKDLMIKFFALITLLVTVAFASALASVSAQTQGQNITASIPFNFNQGHEMQKTRNENAMDRELAKINGEAEPVTMIAAMH